MVSTRPSPTPARGRVAYPSVTSYVPGDSETSPTYVSSPDLPSVLKVTSPESSDRDTQGLKTWWKTFREKNDSPRPDGRGVFSVPLTRSIEYASVQISTAGPDGALSVWGVIPVVVAKCGLYLKENATEVEGTFRISGSAKRMKELQAIFDTGPKYGKDIDWKALSFTTHDVATIFRRFLTQMPEPIIPFEFYDEFRATLSEDVSDKSPVEETISQYKSLIQALPPFNHYLLLYVLDMLSVFAKKADVNLMTVPNLALIFQPGILSHPIHTMRPRDHVLSQQVLEFLIENQDHFLIGMQLKPTRRTRKENPASIAATPLATPPPSSPVPSSPTSALAPPLLTPPLALARTPSPASVPLLVQASPPVQASSPVPPSPLIQASPPAPTPPPLVRADSDMMVPSDSDDEAPIGGYYVIEGKNRLELVSPTSPTTLPAPHTTMTSLEANLLPQKPSRPVAGSRPKPRPVIETMAPSDSDEDAPPGGYEVRMGDPSARAALLARNAARRSGSRASQATSSIARRKTAPARRVAATARPRGRAKEAP